MGVYRYEMRFTAGAVRVLRYGDHIDERRVAAVAYGLPPRMAMRYEFSGLPWWRLGPRLVFVTLTLPHPWRFLVPDARALHAKRRWLYSAWLQRWKELPVGVWALEFQPRAWAAPLEQQAPHLHFYLGLPGAVGDEEFEGLRRRLWRRLELEAAVGPKAARGKVGAPHGEFCDWLVKKWTRILCGPSETRRLIFDVRPVYWSEAAYRDHRGETVADYFWRESGKAGQKEVPERFGRPKLWGSWKGKGKWFVPVEERRVVSGRVAWRMGRALAHARDVRVGTRHVVRADGRWCMHERGRRARSVGRRLSKVSLAAGDGATLFVSDADVLAERLHAWAQATVAARRQEEWDTVVERFVFDGWSGFDEAAS